VCAWMFEEKDFQPQMDGMDGMDGMDADEEDGI
jgi:hypothetical protein